ncbi:MAG: hypothetical protein H6733_10410 [Alphaproteobacteria bacterium]|nr:hypothetical protein [Alphaproteobacteria bacterium]
MPPEMARRLEDALALIGALPDAPAWWDEALRLKDEMPLKDLAAHLGVPVATLTAELKSRGVRRRIKVDKEETPMTSSSAAESHAPDRRSGSKDVNIEHHFHLLGKVPDSEVAKLAGVSVRTIASYRARNDIAGYTGPRRRPQPRGRRESKVDDFAELLGKVPDRVVADIAGMSLGAVRNFRIKKEIEPAGRITTAEIDAIVKAYKAGQLDDDDLPPEPEAPAPKAKAPKASAAPAPRPAAAPPPPVTVPSGPMLAWRFMTTTGREPFIVVAGTLHDAAARAERAVGDPRRISGMECLGEVLA